MTVTNSTSKFIANTTTMTITNSTVNGQYNPVFSQHGGITNYGRLTVTNSTVSGVGGNGTGVTNNGGTLRITGSTISGNTGVGIRTNGGTVSVGYSIATGNTGGNVVGAFTALGPNLIGGDARRGPLRDNGGPTQTLLPLPGSPAIDTGGAGCPATDQRGVARPQGAACDIGAVEVEAIASAPSLRATTAPMNAPPAPMPPARAAQPQATTAPMPATRAAGAQGVMNPASAPAPLPSPLPLPQRR